MKRKSTGREQMILFFKVFESLRIRLRKEERINFSIEDVISEFSKFTPKGSKNEKYRLSNDALGIILKTSPEIVSIRKSTKKSNNGNMIYRFNEPFFVPPPFIKLDGEIHLTAKIKGALESKAFKKVIKKSKGKFPLNWITQFNLSADHFEQIALLDKIIDEVKKLDSIEEHDMLLKQIDRLLKYAELIKNPKYKAEAKKKIINLKIT